MRRPTLDTPELLRAAVPLRGRPAQMILTAMMLGALVFVAALSVIAAFAINGPTPEAVRHLTMLIFLGPPLLYTFLYAPVAAGAAKLLLKDERATWQLLLTVIYSSGFLGIAIAEVLSAVLTYIVVVEHASRQAVIIQLLVVALIWGALGAYIGARLAWTKYLRLTSPPANDSGETVAPAEEPTSVSAAAEAESKIEAKTETADAAKPKTAPRSRASSQSGRSKTRQTDKRTGQQ